MRRIETSPWWPECLALKDKLSLRELAERFKATPGAINAAFARTGTPRVSALPGPRDRRGGTPVQVHTPHDETELRRELRGARLALGIARKEVTIAQVRVDRLLQALADLTEARLLGGLEPRSLVETLGIVKCATCGRTTDGARMCWRCADDDKREG